MTAPAGGDSRRIYTTAISKGAGMVQETRRLLEIWRPEEGAEAFARRVHEEGLVGGGTAYRARDIVKRVFVPRFLTPDDRPARMLQRIAKADLPGRTFTELLFTFTARQDPLVYDFTVREYWPAAKRGRLTLDVDAVLAFLSEARIDGRLDNPWSDNVSVRIARCVLGLLRDVGFLRETSGGRREITDYRLSDEGAALLAWDLHDSGATDAALCSHPDWSLFGLSVAQTLERLDALGEHRGLIVQRAGSVTRLTWTVRTAEELVNALSR